MGPPFSLRFSQPSRLPAPEPSAKLDSLELRDFLRALFRAAVAAVDPERLVARVLGRRGNAVVIRALASTAAREFVFVPRRFVILAVGKAAVPMAVAAHKALGDRIDGALVVAPIGAPESLLPRSFRFLPSSHPLPDALSLEAGQEALALARRLEADDLLLVLLSGGASALMALPAEEVPLEDKARTSTLLEAAGAPAGEVNLVRGSLSRIKAGRLAAAARAADMVTLVLSDLGDGGWHLVGSGPTLGVPPSRRDAWGLLQHYRLTPLVPQSVRSYLNDPFVEAHPPEGGQRWSVLLGTSGPHSRGPGSRPSGSGPTSG